MAERTTIRKLLWYMPINHLENFRVASRQSRRVLVEMKLMGMCLRQ